MGWTFWDWLQYLISFAFVIGLLLALLWTLRKLQNGALLRKPSGRMQTLETLSLGPRQKLVLVKVDEQEILIGVSAGQLIALPPLQAPSPKNNPKKHNHEALFFVGSGPHTCLDLPAHAGSSRP